MKKLRKFIKIIKVIGLKNKMILFILSTKFFFFFFFFFELIKLLFLIIKKIFEE